MYMRTACKAQHKESESARHTGKLVDQANYNVQVHVMVCSTAQNRFERMYARRIALLTD